MKKEDSRIIGCEDEDGLHVIIIGRDTEFSTDYLITFTNKKIKENYIWDC